MPEFIEFPKIPRLSRDCVITEKIDGMNGCVYIDKDGELFVGNRSGWIRPDEQDCFDFYEYVMRNREDFLKLGPGRHFGEYYGYGIQREYGMKDRKFVLFNTLRWRSVNLPKTILTVPILYQGLFNTNSCLRALDILQTTGSMLVPGYMNPEGIVVYHIDGKIGFKKTLKNDEPKGKQ